MRFLVLLYYSESLTFIRPSSLTFVALPGNVTVSATNGDSINFHDIPDTETTRDTIWQLVEERTASR
jgi:hypothetical protein